MLIYLPSAIASRLLFNLHNTQSKDTGKASIAVLNSSVLRGLLNLHKNHIHIIQFTMSLDYFLIARD